MKLFILFFFLRLNAAEICSIQDVNEEIKNFLLKENKKQSELAVGYDYLKKVSITPEEKIRKDLDRYNFASSPQEKKYQAGALANSYRLAAEANASVGNSVKSLEYHKEAAALYDILADGKKVIVSRTGDVEISKDVFNAVHSHMMAGERDQVLKYVNPKDYLVVIERMNQTWIPQIKSTATNAEKYAALIEKYQLRKLQLEMAKKFADPRHVASYSSQINADLTVIKGNIEALSRVL